MDEFGFLPELASVALLLARPTAKNTKCHFAIMRSSGFFKSRPKGADLVAFVAIIENREIS
ncbi:hypothetical protein K2Z83_15065 [Oscillochloris sp. ZM17-4]|uniref:hypothetical protein n=1 Tax=Oscillochloris sp. ZM17-4 TaxID=2866714 RepID=UPI001C732DA6|nr:hypothetical protein [Oscillochloris sp. ZM17-4]MBX0328997.1 hypothetical protein [Oscillochloris sp. ZM17-4]